MSKNFTGTFEVEDAKRRHLRNGDRLQIVLESAYNQEAHKELIDYLGAEVAINVEMKDEGQMELYEKEEE